MIALLVLCIALGAAAQRHNEIPGIGSTAHFFDDEFHVLGGTDGFNWYDSHLKFSPEFESDWASKYFNKYQIKFHIN
jgi:hypothetical protein